MIAALALVAEILPAIGVQASTTVFVDGNKLYENCSSSEVWKAAVCAGYIAAVSDGGSLEAQVLAPPRMGIGNLLGGTAWCQPITNLEQVKDIVIMFLRDNHQIRHQPGAGLVALALSKAFPCK